MNIWTVLVAIALVALITVVFPVAMATFVHYRRPRRLTCPMTGAATSVEVKAGAAAISEVFGGRKLDVRDCSRWPRAWGCRQGCVDGADSRTPSATRHTILVPLDGTPAGDAILPRVASLAREENADVRLMRVARTPAAVVSGNRIVSFTDQEIARVELQEQAYLNDAAERLPGVRVSQVIRFGSPVEKIVDEAEASGANVIVMATHRHTMADRFRWRNIPEAVASATRIPLVRVPCG